MPAETLGTMRKHVAADLRLLRKIRSLTQAELAEMLSIGNRQVSDVESGQKNITLHTLDRFLTGLLGPLPQVGYSSLEQRVGTRIRNARKRYQLTQRALAHLAGTNARYVTRLENAEVSSTLDQLERLAVVLNLQVWQLVDGIEEYRNLDKPPPKAWMRGMLESWTGEEDS